MTDHNDTVTREERINQCLSKEHAVSHIAYPSSFLIADILKANGVSNLKECFQQCKVTSTGGIPHPQEGYQLLLQLGRQQTLLQRAAVGCMQ